MVSIKYVFNPRKLQADYCCLYINILQTAFLKHKAECLVINLGFEKYHKKALRVFFEFQC